MCTGVSAKWAGGGGGGVSPCDEFLLTFLVPGVVDCDFVVTAEVNHLGAVVPFPFACVLADASIVFVESVWSNCAVVLFAFSFLYSCIEVSSYVCGSFLVVFPEKCCEVFVEGFVAATVFGCVHVGAEESVWYGTSKFDGHLPLVVRDDV